MKNKAITIFAIILLIPGFSFAQADRTPNGKKVPVVVYTPFDFYGRLMDAFRCGPEQDYYVVGEDNHSIFDNRIGSGYYSGAYQERELREGRILNISDFKDAIMSNDSCFFFAPLPSRKYDNAYLGIKNGKKLWFVDQKGHQYASLEELLTAACGGESLDAFFDAYLREVEDALTHRGTRNMLYSIDSEEQAVSVLKNNYDFLYFADHDVDSAIDNFLNDLASLVRIDEATEARLQDALHLFFAEQPESGPESESFNTNFRTYIENRDAGRIFLMLTDVSSLLKSALSDDDYTTFSRKHLIQQNKTVAAYNYLVRKYNDEIYRGRIKGWIPPYDLEIEYLADRVLFPKDQSAKR